MCKTLTQYKDFTPGKATWLTSAEEGDGTWELPEQDPTCLEQTTKPVHHWLDFTGVWLDKWNKVKKLKVLIEGRFYCEPVYKRVVERENHIYTHNLIFKGPGPPCSESVTK